DAGNLQHVTLDERGDVRAEERCPPPRSAPYCFGESAGYNSVQVVAPTQLRRMLDVRTVPESGVDEPIGIAVDLALGERPQLDHFHATGKRVRKASQSQDSRGTREQEAARSRVEVHAHLDR